MKIRDLILKRITTLVLPFIQVYGFYVIFHGQISPGGSFAGGIIVALGFIAYATAFGTEEGRAVLPEKVTISAESYGTLWYALLGMVGIVKGVPFLANKLAGIDLGVPGTISSGGLIALLGIGVGIRVASTMVTLFFTMLEEEV
ncbi:MAG: sodium:proton antiporter [Firmicutes bacterium]|jgi:multicomponent Na+:H+ antiporter subunit B|nr:sodium:proton antiporter [Bacillota bacterium]